MFWKICVVTLSFELFARIYHGSAWKFLEPRLIWELDEERLGKEKLEWHARGIWNAIFLSWTSIVAILDYSFVVFNPRYLRVLIVSFEAGILRDYFSQQ